MLSCAGQTGSMKEELPKALPSLVDKDSCFIFVNHSKT